LRISIVTDSTCDLPQNVVDVLGIGVVPMYINFGDASYLDGVTITREEFYVQLVTSLVLPTTATPGIDAFVKVYQAQVDKGAEHIISVHLPAALSGVVDAATQAAAQVPVPVTVVDGGSLSLGTGFLAQTAAQAALAGHSLAEILRLVEDQKRRTHVFAVLDTMEYLQRSGRVSRLVAALGSLLRIKPLLRIHMGEVTGERVRTTRAAVDRLVDILREQLPLARVALVHTHAISKAEALRQRVQALLPPGPVLSVDVTPVLGVHLGPGAVGFACVREPAVNERA